LPLLVGVVLGLWGWSGAFQVGAPLAAAVVTPVVAALVWSKRRFPQLSPVPTRWYPKAVEGVSSWMQREASRLYDWSQHTAESITRTVEGEAGIMLSLLLLVLFVSLITGRAR